MRRRLVGLVLRPTRRAQGARGGCRTSDRNGGTSRRYTLGTALHLTVGSSPRYGRELRSTQDVSWPGGVAQTSTAELQQSVSTPLPQISAFGQQSLILGT